MTTTTIQTLKSIVSSQTTALAEKAISEQFNVGKTASVSIRKDIQDVIDGKMSEAEAKHYISEYGVAVA